MDLNGAVIIFDEAHNIQVEVTCYRVARTLRIIPREGVRELYGSGSAQNLRRDPDQAFFFALSIILFIFYNC